MTHWEPNARIMSVHATERKDIVTESAREIAGGSDDQGTGSSLAGASSFASIAVVRSSSCFSIA